MRPLLFPALLVMSLAPLPAAAGNAGAADSLRPARTLPIDGIIVTGTRDAADPRLLPMTVTVVGRSALADAFRPSVLPTLTEQVPGLFVTSRGIMGYGVSTGAAGGMTIRGIGGSPTTGAMVLVDGRPQYMGLMGHPIADACRTVSAERVEVVRGPASALYGSNAMGGVINIVTRRMERDGVETGLRAGYGSFNTLQTELTNRIRRGRFSSSVAGSYDRTDGSRPDMEFEQYGGRARFDLRISDAWNLSADADLTHFNASNPGPVTAPLIDNDSRITRGAASLTLSDDYPRTSGALSLYCNWGHHRIDDGYSPGGTPPDYRFDSHDRIFGVSWHRNLRLFEGNVLTVGFDYRNSGGRARNRYLDGRPDKILADKTLDEVAGYIDFRQEISRRLTLDAALRLDCDSHSGTEWVPRAGLSLRLPHDMQLKASVGKGFRFPTIREMYMFPPQNPDLKAERLLCYELSVSQRTAEGRVSYSAAAYFIDGEDMIMLVSDGSRRKYMNTGRVENCGVEADIRWAVSHALTLKADYSWLSMKYPVLAAPEHKLFCGIDFAKNRWRGSTGVMYVRGLYTSTSPVVTESFVLWNADAAFRIARSVEIFVRGENLLAWKYETNAGYPMPGATVFGGINVKL